MRLKAIKWLNCLKPQSWEVAELGLSQVNSKASAQAFCLLRWLKKKMWSNSGLYPLSSLQTTSLHPDS